MASEEFIRANFSEEMNDKFYDNYDVIDDRTIDNEESDCLFSIIIRKSS